MQAEKQSLLSSFNSSASTPEPTLGHSSEWTVCVSPDVILPGGPARGWR